jgi:A/G-specific adenine glycosylase
VREAVLAWYGSVGRELAFRATRDPYAILVSEVMAQQTQIARAAEYWRAWMARFPTFEALAAASPADVLRTWRGLGYDRRALNLLRCARIVVARHGGRLPRAIADLEQLPGLGPYTARAVAALAFGERVGAVDVNVRRVVGRIVGGPDGPAALGTARLQAAADALVPADEPGRWTHAVMDLGATVCRVREPRCPGCPARPWCSAGAVWVDGGLGAPRRGAGMPGAGDVERPAAVRRAARERPVPFTSTRRWLRGRILDRLREVDGDGWATFAGPFGEHDPGAVEATLRTLAGEGMVELAEAGAKPGTSALRARLPAR